MGHQVGAYSLFKWPFFEGQSLKTYREILALWTYSFRFPEIRLGPIQLRNVTVHEPWDSYYPKNPDPFRSIFGCFGFQSHKNRIGMDRGPNPRFQSDIPARILREVVNVSRSSPPKTWTLPTLKPINSAEGSCVASQTPKLFWKFMSLRSPQTGGDCKGIQLQNSQPVQV